MLPKPIEYKGNSYFVKLRDPDHPVSTHNLEIKTLVDGEIYPVYFIEETEREEFTQLCEKRL